MPEEPQPFNKVLERSGKPDPVVVGVDPEDEFRLLEDEVTRLEDGNRILREQLLKRYTNFLRILNKDHPLHAQAVSRVRTLRDQLRLLEPEVVATEVVAPESDPIFTTLQADELFAERDRLQCVEYFIELPPKLKPDYLKRLQDVYTKPTEAVRITSLRAIMFEMSRMARVVQQQLEAVDVTARMDGVVVDYDGYHKDETVFDAAHRHTPKKGSEIDFDVPISRDGKPYSYEVKSYSRKRYGHEAAARNQLLKYQTAIEQGKISGATVEVRGRIDPEFLNWAMGTAIDDRGFVPDVEVIYTTELPSGKEYRFVLKRSERGRGLQFKNEEKYSPEELILIRGIQHSLIDKSIRGLLADTHIEADAATRAHHDFFADSAITTAEPSDQAALKQALTELFGLSEDSKRNSSIVRELINNVHDRDQAVAVWEKLLGPVPADLSEQPLPVLLEKCRKQLRSRAFTDQDVFAFCSALVGYEVTDQPQQAVRDLWNFTLADPARITSARMFNTYERLRTDTIIKKLEAIEERSKINRDNKACATSELANPVYIERLVREQQEFLAQNPTVAAMKRQYVLRPEQIPTAVERTMATLMKVRDFELTKQTDPLEADRQQQRRKLGYGGRSEGVALDIEHVMIDTIYSMNSEGLERSEVLGVLDKTQLPLFCDEIGEDSTLVKLKFRSETEMQATLQQDKNLRTVYDKLPQKKKDRLSNLFKRAEFVRSYEWPERFKRAEDLSAYLETQDRRYQEIQIYDPTTGKTERQVDTNDENIERTENVLTKENIQRAREYITGTKRAEQHRRSIASIEKTIQRLTQDRDAALQSAQVEAQTAMAALGRQASPEQRKAVFDKVRNISADFQSQLQGQYRALEDIYQKIIPRDEWNTIAKHIVHRIDENVIKFIYAVTADGEIIVQEEVLRAQVTGRAAHSELAQGRNTYGAGELAFEKRNGQWALIEVNNGSGHYRPDADNTLHYTKNLMQQKGIDISQAQAVDCILRGRPLREATAF